MERYTPAPKEEQKKEEKKKPKTSKELMNSYIPLAVYKDTKGKKPSEYQTAFLRRVRECGGVGFVCDDDTEVLELLKENLHQAKLPIDQH